jgi:hypothetical protein
MMFGGAGNNAYGNTQYNTSQPVSTSNPAASTPFDLFA